MKKTKKPKIEIADRPAYFLSLALNGKTYLAEGETLVDAIKELKPEHYKTKGVLSVEKGDKKTAKMFNIRQMKRLFTEIDNFSTNIARTVAAKNIELLLK